MARRAVRHSVSVRPLASQCPSLARSAKSFSTNFSASPGVGLSMAREADSTESARERRAVSGDWGMGPR